MKPRSNRSLQFRHQESELREELEEQKREISKISSLHFAVLSEINAAKRCLVS